MPKPKRASSKSVKAKRSSNRSQRIPFSFHPRAFASLGAELVTNDVVAIIELVKNSYDALAPRVDVRFIESEAGDMRIEIQDDGSGMTRSVIENVWCVVATPYRKSRPVTKQQQKARRVSGEKGLGRLSSARLGNNLEMLTKSASGPCWQVKVIWPDLAAANDLKACKVDIKKCPPKDASLVGPRGTLLRITNLNSEWDEKRINDLREQLSRLISPFYKSEDFKIWLTLPGKESPEEEIEAPEFLSHPPYSIKGSVDEGGLVDCTYYYSALQHTRSEIIKVPIWENNGAKDKTDKKEDSSSMPRSGPFEFEIRAWDIDPASIELISQRFEAKRSTVRKDIRNYRGISLYRDKILVLPKSDTARDWLGLDLRRVSKVGSRLSTSQIVGYVAVAAEGNEGLKDTSDRERLEDNQASQDLKKLLWRVVGLLENERSKDRDSRRKEKPFKDLFAELSPKLLIEQMRVSAAQGEQVSEVLPFMEEYEAKFEDTLGKIQQRLIYYSRLASLGVMSALIVHEVRNHVLTFGRLHRGLRKLIERGDATALSLEGDLNNAEQGARSLDRLSERFAPLASRNYRSGKRESVLEEIISRCLSMRQPEMEKKNITASILSKSATKVPIDPGELTAVIINLLDNSMHWLSHTKDRPRLIEFEVRPRTELSRVDVRVNDSGPGVKDGEEDRIFWPGVTSKPDGLGMGLTVASEIIDQYGGKMHLLKPGKLEGASFGFDFPMAEKGASKK